MANSTVALETQSYVVKFTFLAVKLLLRILSAGVSEIKQSTKTHFHRNLEIQYGCDPVTQGGGAYSIL